MTDPKYLDPANYGPGKTGPQITWLGQRLVLHGFGKHYSVGPGPRWGESDRLNVQDFQLAQGWTGTQPGGGADGLPGRLTLQRLDADPVVTEPEPELKTELISRISDSRIGESSALARSRKVADLAWTTNDERQSPQVFGIRISTGAVVATFDLKGGGVYKDPEAIAINASGQICFGDFGDNDGNRKDCSITVVNDPGLGNHGPIASTRYPITYADGPRNAETLLIHPITNEHFIVSKESRGRLYTFGSTLNSSYSTVGRYIKEAANLPAYATDGTFSDDGQWVYLRAKDKQILYVYEFKTWKKVKELPCPTTTQGESVTTEKGNKSVIIGSEGKKSPLYRVVLPEAYWPQGSDPDPQEPGEDPKPATLPSKVLDLKNWKLTLPVGSNNKPTEIKQPDLADFTDSRYFHVDASGNGVIFRAHAGGVTTSNSGYPRSELREMKGSANAGWSTASGTHTMTITQTITHVPDVKKHVVAGQIHDADDDVVMIRLEGSRLFVESRGKEIGLLTASYSLGTKFTVKMVAQQSSIKVYYGPTLVAALSGKFEGCYFKAGCYTQSNVSKGDKPEAYGEVLIHSLSVTHI